MSAVDGYKTRPRAKRTAEDRRRLSESAKEAHDRRRGFSIPEHLKAKARKFVRDWHNQHRNLNGNRKRTALVHCPPELLKAALGLCFVLAFIVPAGAHEAPSGWRYPVSCCGLRDCAPLPANALEPTPDGWRIIATGEVIPYGQVRASGDNQNHRCRKVSSDLNSGTRGAHDAEGYYRCLFIAPPGG